MKPEPIIVLVTCGSEEEAIKIAQSLVAGQSRFSGSLHLPMGGKDLGRKGMDFNHQDTKAKV